MRWNPESSRARSDDGSTPEPRSVTRTTRLRPRRAVRASSRTAGGVVSFTQKRNVNRPAERRSNVSKTRSYAPAAGGKTPTTGSSPKKFGWDGVGRGGSPGEAGGGGPVAAGGGGGADLGAGGSPGAGPPGRAAG